MQTEDTFGRIIIRHGSGDYPTVAIVDGVKSPISKALADAILAQSIAIGKMHETVALCLSMESYKHDVLVREMADILGLPHEGPRKDAMEWVGTVRARLAELGYHTDHRCEDHCGYIADNGAVCGRHRNV
jgi:hypothetical protein